MARKNDEINERLRLENERLNRELAAKREAEERWVSHANLRDAELQQKLHEVQRHLADARSHRPMSEGELHAMAALIFAGDKTALPRLRTELEHRGLLDAAAQAWIMAQVTK